MAYIALVRFNGSRRSYGEQGNRVLAAEGLQSAIQ